MHPNSDLFYLSGIEQEESISGAGAVQAEDEKLREILFLREPNEHLKVWEGHKHTKEQATQTQWRKDHQMVERIPRRVSQVDDATPIRCF